MDTLTYGWTPETTLDWISSDVGRATEQLRLLTLAKTPGSASITAVRHFIAFVLTATAFSESTFKI